MQFCVILPLANIPFSRQLWRQKSLLASTHTHTPFFIRYLCVCVCVWRVKKFGDSPTIPPFKTLIFISIFRNVCGTFYGTAVELNVLVHLNRHQHIVKSCQASKYLVRKIQQQNEKHRVKLCSHISHWFAVQLRIVFPINHSVHAIQIRIQLTLLKSVCCVTSNNRQKSNGPSRFFRAKKPSLLIINQSWMHVKTVHFI